LYRSYVANDASFLEADFVAVFVAPDFGMLDSCSRRSARSLERLILGSFKPGKEPP